MDMFTRELERVSLACNKKGNGFDADLVWPCWFG